MYKLIYLARRAPTVARAEWPRTWRSHAVFASQFPALEADIAYLCYCNRVDDVALDGLSTGHDGVAIAGGDRLEALNGSGFDAEDRAKIDADELRVFDMPTSNFTFLCTEAVLREGQPGEAAVFRFLPRNPEMTRDSFDIRWGEKHAQLAKDTIGGIDGITRYVHNRPVHEALDLFPFDGIVETWFGTVDDAVAAVTSQVLDPIAQDLATFCDMNGSVTLLTKVCHSWPKD